MLAHARGLAFYAARTKGTPLKKTTASAARAAFPQNTIRKVTASRALSTLLLAVTTLWALPAAGANLWVANIGSATIGEYNATTGATVNVALVSGLNQPHGIAVVPEPSTWVLLTIGAVSLAVAAVRRRMRESSASITMTGLLPRALSTLLLAVTALWALPAAGANLFVTNFNGNTIGEYNATTGAPVNASLVSGLSNPQGIAVSGGNLWVTNPSSGTIGEYNATTGAPVNASLVSGLILPHGIAVSGGNLWVTDSGIAVREYNATTGAPVNTSLITGFVGGGAFGIAVSGANLWVTIAFGSSNTIGEYNATTGAPVNASLVSGLGNPVGIAVSGANLWVTDTASGTVGEYNATTGAPVNVSLVSGLSSPFGIAVSGANLWVTNGLGTIGEYNATTGAPVNASLVTGLSTPEGIAVVPEPSSMALAGLAAAGLAVPMLRRRRNGRP